MSGSEDQGGAGRREVAYRLFAAEFEDADFSYSESDEERAPNYVVTPTGARVNRLFVVGVLTEVENASEDVLRARIVDPTGAFVVYAGQYQPDAQAFFDRAEPPMFVAVTGKARTFQPDDSDVTYTSVRPENVNEVDAETRDRWTVGTVRRTLHRVATMAGALGMDERGDDLAAALEARGVDEGLAAGTALAIEHYGTTPAYLKAVRDIAVSAAEVVAGERDEVEPLRTDPDSPGEADLAALASLAVPASVGGESDDSGALAAEPSTETDLSTEPAGGATENASTAGESAEAASGESAEAASGESATAESATETGSEPASETETEAEPAAADAEVGTDSATGAASPTATQSSTEPERTTDADTGSETEPAAESEPATASAGDADEADDLGDFDPGEFELDEDEREEIEQEYGTEFKSGTEVGEPGEADIETPEPEPEAEPEAGAETESESEPEPEPESTDDAPEPDDDDAPEPTVDETESEPETNEGASDDAEPAEDVDLDEAVMDAMAEQDAGDGAAEADIVDAVTARTGADADAVRDAIQEALMQGQCYEPEDGVFKPI